MTDKKTILITGANGLLGRRCVERFKNTHEVHATVHRMPNHPVNGVAYHQIDFSGDWDYAELPQSIDAVLHFAQSSKFRDFPDQAMDIFRVNVNSTAKLLDFSRSTNVKRFIYASSGGVYGAGAHAFHENSPIEAHGRLGYYLGSKLCGEILTETYAKIMVVGVLRFFFMYGPEQKKSMLIPRLIDNVQHGEPITIQGHEGIFINPVHVQDATNALEKAIDLKESNTINIAGAHTYSLRDIATIIGHAVGREPIFKMVPGEPQNLIADIDSMRNQLITPTITLEQGIQNMVQEKEAAS